MNGARAATATIGARAFPAVILAGCALLFANATVHAQTMNIKDLWKDAEPSTGSGEVIQQRHS